MAREGFDPNFVAYDYISLRLLSNIVAQEAAGHSSWRPREVTAKYSFISMKIAGSPDSSSSPYELVKKAEDKLTFGSTSEPGLWLRGESDVEAFVLHTLTDRYRVGLVKSETADGELLILFGSIDNFFGLEPNNTTSPTGFRPSFAGALAPLLNQLVKGNRRLGPYPESEAQIRELVMQAANFAFEFQSPEDAPLKIMSGRREWTCQLWYQADNIRVASLRHGRGLTYRQVLIGTPLWIRTPPPSEMDSS